MGTLRLLAMAGLGYAAYRWLRRRPQTAQRLKGAWRDLGEAARHGDVARARGAIGAMGEAVGGPQLTKGAQAVVGSIQEAIGGGRHQAAGERLCGSAAECLTALSRMSLAQARAGNLAAEKGTRQEIREIGAALAGDFERVCARLCELAGRIGVELPEDAGNEGRYFEQSLALTAGQLFDVAYVDEAMNLQILLLDLCQDLIDAADDAELRRLAGELQPGLRRREVVLRQIADNLHRRENLLPGPGTSEGIFVDRSAPASPPPPMAGEDVDIDIERRSA